ncbi:MAG: insulinase family protein, partial [Acidobacteriota bacterium]
PHHPALEVLNTAFGGQFVSRLNLNLREDKGYTYGVRSHFAYHRWAGEWVITTQVETGVAAAALREILNELEALAGARPLTPEEVSYASGSLINGHPRGFETPAQVARALAEVALHGLPEDTLESFQARVAAVTPAQLAELAADIARPSVAAIAIVGDRAALEADLAALEVGPVVPVDPQEHAP